MNCSFSLQTPKALPSPYSSRCGTSSMFIAYKYKPSRRSHSTASTSQSSLTSRTQKSNDHISLKKSSLALQIGALLALVEQPALAVTGENNQQELSWVLIQLGIVLFVYFIAAPPVIMNWMRTRWYKRNLVEMYFQFMFTFIFFPGIMLWAPFLNFRKFPRDPSMKYPWSTPEDPSKIKNAYLKYPFAKLEDYE